MISPHHSDALFLIWRWRLLCSQRSRPPSAAPRVERGFFVCCGSGNDAPAPATQTMLPVARY